MKRLKLDAKDGFTGAQLKKVSGGVGGTYKRIYCYGLDGLFTMGLCGI